METQSENFLSIFYFFIFFFHSRTFDEKIKTKKLKNAQEIFALGLHVLNRLSNRRGPQRGMAFWNFMAAIQVVLGADNSGLDRFSSRDLFQILALNSYS